MHEHINTLCRHVLTLTPEARLPLLEALVAIERHLLHVGQLKSAAETAASMARQDWLEGQQLLADALGALKTTHKAARPARDDLTTQAEYYSETADTDEDSEAFKRLAERLKPLEEELLELRKCQDAFCALGQAYTPVVEPDEDGQPTPGPWRWAYADGDPYDDWEVDFDQDGRGVQFRGIPARLIGANGNDVILPTPDPPDEGVILGVNYSDAQLIVAAPIMWEALKEIADPVGFMQKRAKLQGLPLDGAAVVQQSNDANYLKLVAEKALKAGE